jgi:hypothetical protein
MKLEILDSSGKVVDEVPASKRRGLNRVTWSMRTKPPLVPPAAQIAFRSTQGQRVLPGQYTVRLTKAGEVSTEPLTIGLDRRATFTLDDRKAQYGAAEHVKTLFARMSKLVAQMNAARAQAAKVAADPNASPAAKAEAKAFGDKVEALRTQVVATKEGGAITGEERLREHMDYAYGAVTSTEQRPTPYALARVDALEKELSEVEAAWAALSAQGMGKVNAAAAAMGLSSVDLAEVEAEDDGARGGDVDALIRGLVGTRFTGQLAALAGKGEKE